MKVVVLGLWHLGTVTSVCLASNNHTIIATDNNKSLVSNFKSGVFPVREPGMEKIFKKREYLESNVKVNKICRNT